MSEMDVISRLDYLIDMVSAWIDQQPRRAPQAAPLPAAWSCPIHGTAKVVPAGVSRRTGRQYASFVVCAEPDCEQRPPRDGSPAPVERPQRPGNYQSGPTDLP